MHSVSKKLPKLRGPVLLLTLLPLMSACASSVPSVTEQTVCHELRTDLPTYSSKDTEQSKQEGARFLATFHAICS